MKRVDTNKSYEQHVVDAEASLSDLGKRISDGGGNKKNTSPFEKVSSMFNLNTTLQEDFNNVLARKQSGALVTNSVPGYNNIKMEGFGDLTERERKQYMQAHRNEARKGVDRRENYDPFKQGDFTADYIKTLDRENEKYKNKEMPRSVQVNLETLRRDSLKSQYSKEHQKRSFIPSEGINGYGLGFKNYMKADAGELTGRGFAFAMGRGSGEALMNSFGIITAKQNAIMKQERTMLGKVLSNATMTRAGVLGSLLYSANADDGVGGFVEGQLSYAAALQGWRVGTSFAPLGHGVANIAGNVAATVPRTISAGYNFMAKGETTPLQSFWNKPAAGGFARGATGLVGGLTGAAVGLAALQAVSFVASDITSNESTIRKVAKNLSTKTIYASTQQTHQTQTARQAALDKLSRSGLNDRALLFGNEARILGGVI